MLSVVDGLSAQAMARPEHLAVVAGSQRLTFAELEQRAQAAAQVLWEQGVRPGDRVATLLPNGIPMVELLFAAARVGAVLCPINLRLQKPEVGAVLADARPRLLVAAEGTAEALPDLPPGTVTLWDRPSGGYAALRDAALGMPFPPQVDDGAPWLLVYTSGTTGRPKGVLRTQRSDFILGLTLASVMGVLPEDVGFAVLPLFHVNSLWFVTLTLCFGATCHIYTSQFHPLRLVEELVQCGATYTSLVPTMLAYLADALEAGRVARPPLRWLLTSSAPLDGTLRDRLLALLPGVRLYEVYGATELGAATLARHLPGEPRGSVGYPLPGVRIRLLGPDRAPVPVGAVGEVFVESAMGMSGYFGRPADTEAAREGSHLSVGDLGTRDASGRLYLVDRLADMIITSGENVYPTEVEDVLLSHPAVRLAAVIGVADPRRGEAVAAVVAEHPGRHATPAELAAHCRARLAPYKCPRFFAYAEELPLGPTGKVLRRAVRSQWKAGAYLPTTVAGLGEPAGEGGAPAGDGAPPA